MPAQPLPAEGSGEYVIRWKTNRTHVTGTLYRRASTGALVELGTERASLPLAQEALARNGEAPYPDELGYVDSVDELGRIGKRIKKFAKKVATSKLGKLVKTAGSIATAFVPGGRSAHAQNEH